MLGRGFGPGQNLIGVRTKSPKKSGQMLLHQPFLMG
jgi:hypothetical protein